MLRLCRCLSQDREPQDCPSRGTGPQQVTGPGRFDDILQQVQLFDPWLCQVSERYWSMETYRRLPRAAVPGYAGMGRRVWKQHHFRSHVVVIVKCLGHRGYHDREHEPHIRPSSSPEIVAAD